MSDVEESVKEIGDDPFAPTPRTDGIPITPETMWQREAVDIGLCGDPIVGRWPTYADFTLSLSPDQWKRLGFVARRGGIGPHSVWWNYFAAPGAKYDKAEALAVDGEILVQ